MEYMMRMGQERKAGTTLTRVKDGGAQIEMLISFRCRVPAPCLMLRGRCKMWP